MSTFDFEHVDDPTTIVASGQDEWGSGEGPLRQFARRLFHNRAAVAALAFLVLMALVAILAPMLTPYDPLAQDLRTALESPSGAHWFGTDDLGRDVFSRVLVAGRISLVAALEAVAVGVVLGVPFGLLAGYAGGWADTVVMRLTDAVLSFPPLILAIAIVGIRGPGLTNAMIAVGIVFAPIHRVLFGDTVRIGRGGDLHRGIAEHRDAGIQDRDLARRSEHPLAADRADFTCRELRHARRGRFELPGARRTGTRRKLGITARAPFGYINLAPWLVIFPGLCIALTVFALNVFGDGVRDAIGREERGE